MKRYRVECEQRCFRRDGTYYILENVCIDYYSKFEDARYCCGIAKYKINCGVDIFNIRVLDLESSEPLKPIHKEN